MVRNDGESTLHGLPAQVQMSRAFVRRGRGHRDEARELVPVNDHLDEVLKLL